MLSHAFNHALKIDVSVKSLRILNKTSQRERTQRKLQPYLPASLIASGSQENGVVQVGEKFFAFSVQLATSIDKENSTNFIAVLVPFSL